MHLSKMEEMDHATILCLVTLGSLSPRNNEATALSASALDLL